MFHGKYRPRPVMYGLPAIDRDTSGPLSRPIGVPEKFTRLAEKVSSLGIAVADRLLRLHQQLVSGRKGNKGCKLCLLC